MSTESTEDSEAARRVALATTTSGAADGGVGGGGDANVLDMAAMAEQSEVLEAELPARFAAAEAVCERAEDGGLRGSADEQASAVAVAAAEMERCMLAVRRHAIFSPNEEAEDVNTEDLKYVLGEYHLAKISSRLSPIGGGPAARLAGVRRAAGYMEAFVTRCKQLGLERAGIEVGESVSRAGDPAARRAAKIDRYRMVKAAKARMAVGSFAVVVVVVVVAAASDCLRRYLCRCLCRCLCLGRLCLLSLSVSTLSITVITVTVAVAVSVSASLRFSSTFCLSVSRAQRATRAPGHNVYA
jgi:hypothetical protein